MTVLRVGTRASKLALLQSRTVATLIEQANPGLAVELVEVSTAGDRDRTSPLNTGVGWFTKAIQQELLENRIDVAVHSYKDLPTAQPAGLMIGAVPEREDPRDAFVSRHGSLVNDLPQGAVVGTSSPRRGAQLLNLRPEINVRVIRGNVDTRLARVDAGDYDATVLALAGLRRMGLEARASHVFSYEEMLPAPAQGALAVECRADDRDARESLARIDQPALRAETDAERAFMAALEAGCSSPAGAYARREGGELVLDGLLARSGQIVRRRVLGAVEEARTLGAKLAHEVLADGALA